MSQTTTQPTTENSTHFTNIISSSAGEVSTVMPSTTTTGESSTGFPTTTGGGNGGGGGIKSGSRTWSHEGRDYWPKQFSSCNGKRQSPISITNQIVKQETVVEDLSFPRYDQVSFKLFRSTKDFDI